MSILVKCAITILTATITTYVGVVLMSLDYARRERKGESFGHQTGNLAVTSGATFAALLYTPALFYFVWGFSWWIALLTTPLGILFAFPGVILFLLAFQVVRRLKILFGFPAE